MKILTVNDETRDWDGPNGTITFISGSFDDDSGWSLGCKPENVAKRKAELQALIGVEGTYELEPKPEYQGRAQWKLKSWPGKPEYSGGGKPRGKSPEEQAAIARMSALKSAVELLGSSWVPPEGYGDVTWKQLATEMYEWISAGSPTAQQNASESAEGQGSGASTSAAENSREKPGQVSGTAAGTTSGSVAYGEGAAGPATVGGGADRPGGTASPSAKRSADVPPPGWEGMWES